MRNLIALRAATVVFVTAANWGCANTTGVLTTGSLSPAASQSSANDAQLRRLHQVATTSARAKRCAFGFDPARLKTSYLDYELRQGAAVEQVSSIAQRYDTTLMSKFKEVEAMPNYCSSRVAALIKAALERHVAGDFTPTPVDPQTLATVAATAEQQPWDAKEVWVGKYGRER